MRSFFDIGRDCGVLHFGKLGKEEVEGEEENLKLAAKRRPAKTARRLRGLEKC